MVDDAVKAVLYLDHWNNKQFIENIYNAKQFENNVEKINRENFDFFDDFVHATFKRELSIQDMRAEIEEEQKKKNKNKNKTDNLDEEEKEEDNNSHIVYYRSKNNDKEQPRTNTILKLAASLTNKSNEL